MGKEPAGEIWSVVIESPSLSKTLALSILEIGSGVLDKPEKKLGRRIYVESSCQGYRGLASEAIASHLGSFIASEYLCLNISGVITESAS